MNQIMNNPSNSYKWWVLIAVSIANFSAALDMSIIVVSFPRLTEVFNTDASVVVWLAIAFSVAELGLLLTLAKVGDIIGRKKVYVFGLGLYTLGLVLCSISPNFTMLLISRIVQGAGAAMTLTVGSAIVVAAFPQEQQGRAIGLFAMFTSVGLIAGPALGGVIIDYLDWQGIFYTRIPVGIITLIMALMIIQEQKEPGARLHLDWGGALTLLGSTGCFLLYLNLGSDWGYTSPTSLALIAAAVVLLGIFLNLERRVAQPVLDLSFFKNRTFTMAGVTSFIQMTAGSAGPVLFPFFIVGGLLLSDSTSGLLLALIAVPPMIISPVTGIISDKIGNRIPMVIATTCFTAALFFGSRFTIETSVMDVALVLALFGVGMGVFMAPNQSAVISTVPRRHLATVMGVANTMRLLGGATGMAIAGTLFARQQTTSAAELALQGIAPDMVDRLSVIESFQYVIFLAAIISFLSIVTSFFIGKPTVVPEES
jgi:EmrB/QacA subfamily drug resistance transporter